MQPRAIETRYSGCRFRSRLEARWAVYLNAIKAKWVYEPEGFVLSDGTHYLPDFFVYANEPDDSPFRETGYWLEVKATPPTETEVRMLHTLCTEKCSFGVLVWGRFPEIQTRFVGLGYERVRRPREALDWENSLPFVTNRLGERGLTLFSHHRALMLAAEARFEHGERPAV